MFCSAPHYVIYWGLFYLPSTSAGLSTGGHAARQVLQLKSSMVTNTSLDALSVDGLSP